MYKCKECGAEYKEKPDYCDCGNDEFEVAGEELNREKELTSRQKAAEMSQEHENQTYTGKNPIKETPKVQPASSIDLNNLNSYIPAKTLSVNPVSLTIFIICIILSIYVILFAFNPTEKEKNVEIKQEAITQKNIPSIDTIWNNAIPAIKKEKPKAEEKAENIIKQIIPEVPKKTEIPKKVQTTVQPKVTKVPITKVSTTSQKKVSATKTTKQQTTNAQEQAKKAAELAAKQKAEQERKDAEAAQLKKLQAEQAKKAEAEKAKQAAVNKQEFISYKAQLRNAIGRKIDFTRVIGDGSCTVAFKIDSNGKLINRTFAKQSSNNTLNDAVYNAVMATPTFNPPPQAYNGEILNLNIKFYNGNFEISLP